MTAYDTNNGFDPRDRDLELATPTLSALLESAMLESNRRLRVCMPASVVKVRGNQLVDLQPLLQVRYFGDAAPTTLPIVPNCPVSLPMGGDWGIKAPIAEGDVGLMLVADRSLDAWMAGAGGLADPADTRTHDLTDAIFLPGLPAGIRGQTTDATDDFTITNGQAQIRLEKNGTFRVHNNGQELVDLVDQLTHAVASIVQTLQSAMTNTMMGPMPFIASTQSDLAQELSTVNQIAQNLQTLQGK